MVAIKRKSFYQLSPFPYPNLIQIQVDSYHRFLEKGLSELFAEISPIEDYTGNLFSLRFGEYFFEEPKIEPYECRENNLTYKASLRCKISLENKKTKEIKEQEIYLGDFPMMTERGTFIINGVERVIVNQVLRSFGVIFIAEMSSGEKLFGAKIIPARGAWLEFETSSRDEIYVKIDRRRRIPITTFLRFLGYETDAEIQALFKKETSRDQIDQIEKTLKKDPTKNSDEACVYIYRQMRPGDLTTAKNARTFLETTFFNLRRYDLGSVGRYKVNQRLGLNFENDLNHRLLQKEDVIETIREIIRLNADPQAEPDDIDHLSSRRIRSVGELVQDRVRIGLLRIERIIRDRMSVVDPVLVTPASLVNARPISAVLQEFFASSQLSQFMNQINPLSELEHKRTVAATGPGGLSRERAGFEVRDVHTSHYGRICPVQTPEGPNIGLVTYLSSYAQVNEYGFLETPYRKVKQTKNGAYVTTEIGFLNASEEEKYIIAPADIPMSEKGKILVPKVMARFGGHPDFYSTKKLDYVDVSSNQIVSISTSLIPFLENTDAARALMGSTMQRQALPLVKPQAPIIGTGVEEAVGKASGMVIIADEPGKVKTVDAQRIVIKTNSGKEKIYRLFNFVRSNQATCLHQRPRVLEGDKISRGDVLADCMSSYDGEIALGQNVLVAFMSWYGFNYEDAIIISQRLVSDDTFSSVYIDEYEIEVRETKLGPEIITRDIPNVSEESLRNLDENGIIRIGAEVSPRDILVGKITPKGETELSGEERLLRAIFGEEAKDVKDSSLRLPHGIRGKVIGVKIFSREKGDELLPGVLQKIHVLVAQLRKIGEGDKLAGRHGNKGVIAKVLPISDMPMLPDGTPVDIILNPLGVVSRMNLGQLMEVHLGWVAKTLGNFFASPVFKGPTFAMIQEELKKANLPLDGKVQLIDGRTGEPFQSKTTVGYLYIMKLVHMVEDKIHARSIGPYSMITQQPLGGKAQFGGQRFGEMEVWALEAYGAAHVLQEMLTIKSDDVAGRSKAFESIIKGEEVAEPAVPESFNVLVKELQGLGLKLDFVRKREAKDKGIT